MIIFYWGNREVRMKYSTLQVNRKIHFQIHLKIFYHLSKKIFNFQKPSKDLLGLQTKAILYPWLKLVKWLMNNTKCILPINLLDVGLLLQATDFTGIHHKRGDGRFATCISITNPSIVSMWISNIASQGGRKAGIFPPSVQWVGYTFNVLWEVTKAYICSTSFKGTEKNEAMEVYCSDYSR